MPRESLNILKFNVGTILSADGEDIPLDAVSYSKNVDGDAPEGKLMGLPKQLVKSSTLGIRAKVSDFIIRDNGKYDLIYYDPSEHKIKAILDFYGTPTGQDLVSDIPDGAPCSIVAHNKAAYIGLGSSTYPKWVGYISHSQFGNSYSGLYAADAELKSNAGQIDGTFSISKTTVTGTDSTDFSSSKKYRYAFSLTYDGYQDSPLSYDDSFTPSSDKETYSIVITAYGASKSPYPSSFNKRVSAIKIWRSESEDTLDAHLGYSRLVKTIELSDSSWTTSGNNKTFTFTDIGDSGAAYNAVTDMPEISEETLFGIMSADFRLWYSLSVIASDYLIVANCSKDILPDASHMIFKSKANSYNMIDWTNDFIRLPFVPKAIAFFNNKLYVFDENLYYRLSPDTLSVEEIFHGVGCLDQRGVLVTEWGMFICNKNNVWLHNGVAPQPIGNYIKKSTEFLAWVDNPTFLFNPIAVFDSRRNSILFLLGDTDSGGVSYLKGWMYNIQRERWDYFEITGTYTDTASIYSGAFSGKNGEVYFSTGTELWNLFGGSSNLNFELITKEITLDDPSQKKKFYNILIDSYLPPGSSIAASYNLDDIGWVNSLNPNSYAKKIRLKFSTSGTYLGGIQIKAISLLFRKLIGTR